MHVHDVQAAVGESDLTRTQRVIIWAICSHRGRVDFTTGTYSGSKRELAKRAAMSVRTLETHLPKLLKTGWLSSSQRKGQSTIYVVHAPPTETLSVGQPETPKALRWVGDRNSFGGSTRDTETLSVGGTETLSVGGAETLSVGGPKLLRSHNKNIQERMSVRSEPPAEEHDVFSVQTVINDTHPQLNSLDKKNTTRDSGEKSAADTTDSQMQMMRLIWGTLRDMDVLEFLHEHHNTTEENALKRAMRREVRMTALALNNQKMCESEARHYLLERLDSYAGRVEVSRWLQYARGSQDLTEWAQRSHRTAARAPERPPSPPKRKPGTNPAHAPSTPEQRQHTNDVLAMLSEIQENRKNEQGGDQ